MLLDMLILLANWLVAHEGCHSSRRDIVLKKQTIDALVAVMHQKDMDILMNIGVRQGIVVNQCDQGDEHPRKIEHPAVQWFNSESRGLSKSRNLALSASSADVCLLVDDDVVLAKDYEEKIASAFEKIPQADVIAFIVSATDNRKWKAYPSKVKRLNLITSMRVSSVQIAFKRGSITRNNIRFDEAFGAGSGQYRMGEENIFLADCLRKKLQVWYVPCEIAQVTIDGESTWFQGYNKNYFVSKGAQFYRMCPSVVHWGLIFQFVLRKRKLYQESATMKRAFQWLREGARSYASSIVGKEPLVKEGIS